MAAPKHLRTAVIKSAAAHATARQESAIRRKQDPKVNMKSSRIARCWPKQATTENSAETPIIMRLNEETGKPASTSSEMKVYERTY